MVRRCVYCEFEFFKKFLSLFQSLNFEDRQCWHNIFSFLSRSVIIFDVPKNVFINELGANKAFVYFHKKSLEGNNQNTHRWKYCTDIVFPNIEKIEENQNMNELLSSTTMILTIKDKVSCNRVMKKYGIMAYNLESIIASEYLFDDSGSALPDEKRMLNGWKSILLQKEINICNSIIIIDNYLLQSNTQQTYVSKSVNEKIDNNLIPIIDALLPKKIDVPFHVTIFAIEGNVPLKTIEADLRRKIRELRGGSVKIYLQICKCQEKGERFHDRVLVTNNIWVSSGMGFDLFGAKGYEINKPTSVSILYPYIQTSAIWVEKAYENTLSFAKQLFEKNSAYGDEFKNRLFNVV